MTNRFGDVCLFRFLSTLLLTALLSAYFRFIPLALLICGFTKSAQVPFSRWLPMAMSAPTPVSSLVHRSTLVTAGVYLFTHYADFLVWYLFVLLIAGLITTFVGGGFALVEKDLKKIVALSTLSQLGFIVIALGFAFALLRFLHLITHALFKSCIFIAVGSLIGSTFSLQDSRGYCRAGVNSLTSHCVLGVCVFSLCGLLFTAGFMSKDLIIASMIRMQSALGIIILFGFRILFTLWYSARMMQAVACVASSSISCNGMNKIMMISLLPVAVGGVVGGLLLVQRCIFIPLSFSSFVKGLPVICLIIALLALGVWGQLDGSSRWIIGQDIITHSTQQSRIFSECNIVEIISLSLTTLLVKSAWFHSHRMLLLIFSLLLLTIF